MTLKERLVHGHVFDPDATLVHLQVLYPIHEEHRVAMRKDAHYLLDVQGEPPAFLPEDNVPASANLCRLAEQVLEHEHAAQCLGDVLSRKAPGLTKQNHVPWIDFWVRFCLAVFQVLV